MRRAAILALAAILANCQTDAPTASGSPEITVPGARPEQIKPLLLNSALNMGMKLRNDTPYQLTFERPWGGAVQSAVVGALLSTNAAGATERLSFSITETGGGTRIVLDRYMVKVGSFGREDATLANGPAPGLEPVQATLDRMAHSLQPDRR